MTTTQQTYATWHADATREPAMEESHRPLWRHFIETIPETDLSTRDVLDFGCNRGGFLRLLNALKPFRHALGIDIAAASIAAARGLVGVSPIDYEVATDLSAWRDRFDLAFSYEVIYLLPDLVPRGRHAHGVATRRRVLCGYRLPHRQPAVAGVAAADRGHDQCAGAGSLARRLRCGIH